MGKSELTCNGTLFHLELHLDDWAQETSWELKNEKTLIVEANQSYSQEDNWLQVTFETCIEPGPYRFSLIDHIGDGISCGKDSGCYNIFIDNDVVIKGLPFQGKIVTHTF